MLFAQPLLLVSGAEILLGRCNARSAGACLDRGSFSRNRGYKVHRYADHLTDKDLVLILYFIFFLDSVNRAVKLQRDEKDRIALLYRVINSGAARQIRRQRCGRR
jgi:hypothetical protein